MVIETDVRSVLEERATPSGLPVFTVDEWEDFKNRFEKNEAIDALAKYIVEKEVPFPLQVITEQTVTDKFLKLRSGDHNKFLYGYTTDITDKFNDYDYSVQKYCKDVVDLGHYYNDVSNYFHQENRLQCNGWKDPSPIAVWNDEEKLRKFNWTFWREGMVKFVDETKWREAFRLGAYVATQFKPTVAKYVYNRFNAKTILDSSCGWGDRLAGFWTSNADTYVGCDPNPQTFQNYISQCIFYEETLGNTWTNKIGDDYFHFSGSKEVLIYLRASETMNWPQLNYDLAFTSPPYYSTERYAEGVAEEKQSWFKYNDFYDWLSDYLFETLDRINDVINPDTGVIAVNIIDANIKNKRHKVCDPMTKYMETLNMPLQEVIGMRMKQRPKNEEGGDIEHMQDCFVEPIWVYSSSDENTQTQFDRLFV